MTIPEEPEFPFEGDPFGEFQQTKLILHTKLADGSILDVAYGLNEGKECFRIAQWDEGGGGSALLTPQAWIRLAKVLKDSPI